MLSASSKLHPALFKHIHTPSLRRYLNTQPCYSDKVFAVPFALDRNRAVQETVLHAINLTTPIDVPISYHFKRFLAVFKDPVINLRPLRIQPIYFPTWRVEAEALSKGIDSEDIIQNTEQDDTAYLLSRELYHPGHHMLPLSTLSFAPFPDSPLLPWNESMSRLKDGTEVVCLPYTLSPLEFASTLTECMSRNKATHSGKSRLLSLHIGPTYPVLFPLYLIQYEVVPSNSGHKPEPLTIVLEGHREGGALFSENISDVYLHPSVSIAASALLSALDYKGDIPLEVTSEGKPSSFISAYRRDPPVGVWEYINHLSSSRVQSVKLRRWILNNWQTPRPKLDWSDIRIQPPTIENLIRTDTFQSVKMILLSEHMQELRQQQATRTGDLAGLHTFLYGFDGGEELRKTQPAWYPESLCKHTTVIRQ